jgi:DNA-directed RNA polymerase subunit E'/Rpb7
MTTAMEQKRNTQSTDEQKIYGVYMRSLLTSKVNLAITEIGQNLRQNLEKKLAVKMEGKCGIEGFIEPGSVNVKTYSNGQVNSGFVEFQVVFECMICRPVEGMIIECTVKTVTKAGVHSEVVGKKGVVPITAFIARDHNYNDSRFNDIKEKDDIVVTVIGVRFELNDPYISVIGKIKDKKHLQQNRTTRTGGGSISVFDEAPLHAPEISSLHDGEVSSDDEF